jgi:hypothetical protein
MADVVPIRQKYGAFNRVRRNSVKRVLNQARGLTDVLVIGTHPDGELHLRGCPNDPGHALWLMEMAKRRLLRGCD